MRRWRREEKRKKGEVEKGKGEEGEGEETSKMLGESEAGLQ